MFAGSVNGRYLDEITSALEDGKLILYPTDTMYAIGCDALNSRAIEQICRIKNLDPRKNRLSILCSDISQAARYAKIDNKAFAILKQFLPGKFTFILPAATALPKQFKGRHEVGIRIPGDKISVAIASALDRPLLTASVDTDSDADLMIPEELADRYWSQGVEILIDAGDKEIEESTVVDLTDPSDPQIVRQGAGIFEI